ncbi:MAG: ABC transporter, permease protein 2 (cluster 1, maltose/g3p/polyamine/iron), partial [uncultured Blastococcus sp.]
DHADRQAHRGGRPPAVTASSPQRPHPRCVGHQVRGVPPVLGHRGAALPGSAHPHSPELAQDAGGGQRQAADLVPGIAVPGELQRLGDLRRGHRHLSAQFPGAVRALGALHGGGVRARRLRVRALHLSWTQSALRDHAVDPHGSVRLAAAPAVHRDRLAGPAEHRGRRRAGADDVPAAVRCLPHAQRLRGHSPGDRGGRPGGRRLVAGRALLHLPPAGRSGRRHGGPVRVHRLLERVPRTLDLPHRGRQPHVAHRADLHPRRRIRRCRLRRAAGRRRAGRRAHARHLPPAAAVLRRRADRRRAARL